jgi:hypothetical protein
MSNPNNDNKLIGIFPNTGLEALPQIEFVGAENKPITLYVNDDNSLVFKNKDNQDIFLIGHSGIVCATGVISVIQSSLVDGGNF